MWPLRDFNRKEMSELSSNLASYNYESRKRFLSEIMRQLKLLIPM